MYSKATMQLTFLTALRGVTPPVVSTSMLVLCANVLGAKFTAAYVALGIISALLCLLVIDSESHARRNAIPSGGLTIAGRVVGEWALVVAALLLIGYATKTSGIFSRRAIFLWFATTPAAMVGALMVLHQWTRAVVASSTHARRCIIVGVSPMGLQLAEVIRDHSELGFRLACIFDPDGRLDGELAYDGLERRSDLAAVHDYVNAQHVETVFIALPIEMPRTRSVLRSLRDTTSSVYLIPDISIFDLIQTHIDNIQGVPVIALCESPFTGLQGALKRATDVVFASIMLLLALPVMLAISIAIKWTSKGTVLFKQHRYGLDGERITVYKFRTMTVTEDGSRVAQARPDDARVTPIGRFLRRTSLDELPQLVNVLQGSMSLVGPRPHAVAHNEQYRKLITGYMVRHKVAPGITGLAQINGCRGETSNVEDMRRRVEYDLEYLRRWCWLLDLKILVKTCGLLFHDEHAY